MFSLSAICRLLGAERECARRGAGVLWLTYNIRKHCAAQEDHMSPPWRIFNPDFELLESRVSILGLYVAFEDVHSVSPDCHPAPLSATAA